MRAIFLFLTFGLFFASCKSDKIAGSVNHDPSFLPPMKIAIAPAIKDDPELVDLVQSSEKAINEFSDNMESMAVESADFIKKLNEKEEKSLGDGLRAMKLLTEFAGKSSEIKGTLSKFETYMAKREEQETISEEQIQALDEVSKAFQNRLKELGSKYEDLFKDINIE